MAQIKPLGVRMAPETKAALDRAAKEEVRSLSSLIEKILVDWLKARGYLK